MKMIVQQTNGKRDGCARKCVCGSSLERDWLTGSGESERSVGAGYYFTWSHLVVGSRSWRIQFLPVGGQ